MITITITTINGYNFNISLSNDDVYKYHVKYQTLVLNTEPLKDDILKNGELILRSKTEKEQRREERTAALLELIGNHLGAGGLIDGFNEMDL